MGSYLEDYLHCKFPQGKRLRGRRGGWEGVGEEGGEEGANCVVEREIA